MDEYCPQASDTREDVDRAMFERLRAMTPLERLQVAMASYAAAERLSIAGLRLRHPDAGEDELRMRAAALRLGRDTMLRFFGERALAWLP